MEKLLKKLKERNDIMNINIFVILVVIYYIYTSDLYTLFKQKLKYYSLFLKIKK